MKKKKFRNKLNKELILFSVLFGIYIFAHFYELEQRLVFGYDQTNNAWMMKDMIIGHYWPLVGMVAKGNSGFFIGPLFYYLLAPFYILFNLNPLAAGIFAGVASCATFAVFYYTVRQMLSPVAAVIAGIIYIFSINILSFDRISWPVSLIPVVSVLVFYFLFRLLQGKTNYLYPLAIVLGFSMHVHFTSIYYFPAVIICLPFIVRQSGFWRKSLIALLIFGLFLLPNIIANAQSGFAHSQSLGKYLETYYHGLHLRRVFQIYHDAFIDMEAILTFRQLRDFVWVPPVLFGILIYLRDPQKRRLVLLVTLWYLIPWIVMSTYRGEITNYYFLTTRAATIITLSYILAHLVETGNLALRILTAALLVCYMYIGIQTFIKGEYPAYEKVKIKVTEAILTGQEIKYQEGVPESYLYWYYKSYLKSVPKT